jgi:hypothetical protein
MADDLPRHPIGFGPTGDRPARTGSPTSRPPAAADDGHAHPADLGAGRAQHPSARGTDTDTNTNTDTDTDDPARRDRDVHRRIVLEAEPAEVWHLLTDADELAAWWGDGTTIDVEPGGDARFREDGEPDRRGRVVEAKPRRRLVFDWWPEDPAVDEPASRVTIELVPCPFGTILTITECVLLTLDELPVLVAPRPTFLPPPWGPGPSARARSRVLVLA